MAALFYWPGVSETISRKLLTFTQDKIDTKDIESYYFWLEVMMHHRIFLGDFDLSYVDMDSFNVLTERMLKVGAFFEVINAVIPLGWFFIEKGDFERARGMADLLGRVGTEYEHGHAKAFHLVVQVRIHIEQGQLKEALAAAHKGNLLTEMLGLRDIYFDFVTFRARVHVLLGDQESAESCFKHQEEIKSNRYLVPYYVSDESAVRSMFYVSCLEEAIKNRDNPRISQLAKESGKWGMKAMKASRKFKRDRVEILRLMGTRSWLMGDRNKALKWWGESVEDGERLKFRPDLSRTYFEIGKRLSEPNSPYKELNSITAAGYLNKAKTMFEEMGLQWDLEQLERVMEHLD
jgi:tetratricopeptide (TPR) repeat protein